MDQARMHATLERYGKVLEARGNTPVRENNAVEGRDVRERQLDHALWMITNLKDHKDSETGQNRWFGFVQGILWTTGVYTIDEIRVHTAPPGTEFEPRE